MNYTTHESEYTFFGKAVVVFIGKNKVIYNRYVQHAACFQKLVGKANVGLAGAGITRGVVMYQYDVAGLIFEGSFEDDFRVSDGAGNPTFADYPFVDE